MNVCMYVCPIVGDLVKMERKEPLIKAVLKIDDHEALANNNK